MPLGSYRGADVAETE